MVRVHTVNQKTPIETGVIREIWKRTPVMDNIKVPNKVTLIMSSVSSHFLESRFELYNPNEAHILFQMKSVPIKPNKLITLIRISRNAWKPIFGARRSETAKVAKRNEPLIKSRSDS